MRAEVVSQEYDGGGGEYTLNEIVIKLGPVSKEYADEICRGVQSYLDLITELETE